MIHVFGTVCLDRIRHIEAMPKLGAYVDIESEQIMLGGEAANTASHLRRWGDKFTLSGNALAKDADGHILMGLLAEHGLSYDGYPVQVEATPVCDVYVTPDGERTMFGVGFSTLQAGPANYPGKVRGWFTTDANLRQQAEFHAEQAKQAGFKLYLMDLPNSSNMLQPGVIFQTSTRWVGGRNDPGACQTIVAETASRTGCIAILTDSGRGLYVGNPGVPVTAYPPFPQLSSVDPTGAGDLFRAGMLHGLDHDWLQSRCLAFAAAAAALGASSVGAAEGPTLDQIEQHLAAHPAIVAHYA